MAIKLPPETTRRLVASIKRYAAENLDEEIGPSIYNQAIADAQSYFTGRVADLEGVCHEPEFGFWPRSRQS
jgi:uncharacterized protein (DUF2164 family)